MTNSQIAETLEEIGDLLEFKGENPFRIRAYRNAARAIKNMADGAADIIGSDDRELTDVEGIGKDLAEKIATLIATGQLPLLNDLRAEVPRGVRAIMRIPGVGPKKAARLYQELHVKTLSELRHACEREKVRNIAGFGAKSEQKILGGIRIAASADERMYWARADEIAQRLREHLTSVSAVKRLEIAGSYRRGKETVGDLDILTVAEAAAPVMDALADFPGVVETIARGETKMSVRLEGGLQVDLRVVPAEAFGAALQYFTGSKEHNVAFRKRAKDRGLKVNEYGVFKVKGGADGNEADDPGASIAGAEEADVYAALDLPLIPPELRENRGEFSFASQEDIPTLIETDDIRGDLHLHTTASDGRNSLREMIEAAQAHGLAYIAVTDHSKRVNVASGLDAVRLRKQWAEIDEIRPTLPEGFYVLKGVECDILEAGGMDLPDDVLAEADWVIASVHFGQNQSKEKITQRIIGALENPHVAILAHPTGRLINRRDPYEVDLDEVMAAAKEHHKMLELNANPARLDLNEIYCAAAKQRGIPVVISTDAHSVEQYANMRFGVIQARRAGLTKADVANTKTFKQFEKTLKKTRRVV